MKLFIKNYFPYILSFFICLIVIFYFYYSSTTQWKKAISIKKDLYNSKCSKYNVIDYNNINESSDNLLVSCYNKYISLNKGKTDTYYTYFSFFNEVPDIFPFALILFVIIPAIYSFHKKVKKGNIKNILSRKKYSEFIKKEYLKSLLSIFIVPICLFILFLLAYKYSGNFDVSKTKSIVDNSLLEYTKHITPIYFMFIYFFNIIIQSIFFVNLSYIIEVKNKYLILTYIECFLIFIGIEVILEFMQKFINYDVSLFSIWNYALSDKFLFIPTIVNILFIIITFFIMYKLYQKKELIVINNEVI